MSFTTISVGSARRFWPPLRNDISRRSTRRSGAGPQLRRGRLRAVRELLLANVGHWIDEYHLDGVRIDATQAFFDESPRHILLELARAARDAAEDRQVLVIGESEPQNASLFRSADQGGSEIDAMWNDDFHHAARVRLTGRMEAYYTDYTGNSAEFAAAALWGYLYQGQRYSWQKKPRGSPRIDIRPERFVHYLQNHDQIANSPRGQRVNELTSPGRLRAMTSLMLLMPQTPLLFQGQEFASSSPFLYFNDCGPDEAPALAAGRSKFLAQFRSYARRRFRRFFPIRATRRISNGASSILQNGSDMPESMPCTAICCTSAAS